MRNVTFVIGALVLAVVAIVGYEQIRPTAQRVASSGATPQSGDSTTELASRLLLPPYLAQQDSAAYELKLYPGTLPPDPKIDLPQPSGSRVVGAAVRLRNKAPAALDVVMDVPESTGDVAAYFERELTKTGWTAAPNRGGPQGGFVSGPVGNSRTFCKGENPPWYSVTAFAVAGAPFDVRAHIDLVNPSPYPGSFGPCSQPAQPAGIGINNGMNKLPALHAPSGVTMRTSGGGGGNDRQSSEAVATGKTSAKDLEAAFAQELVAAGWIRAAGSADGPIAWSTWKVAGDGNWHGLLLVNELSGEVRSLLLQAQLVQ